MTRLAVATWNVHRCVGGDGRRDPDRVARALRDLDCDVVGLQEVDCLAHDAAGFDQLTHLARAAGGLHVAGGPCLRRGSVTTGNAVVARHPIASQRWIDLSLPGREPRGALDVALDVGGARVRVVNTHLGLRGAERAAQAERLLAALDEGPEALTVLLGDLNEWYPRGRSLRRLAARFEGARPTPTFPAAWPVLPLDRVFVRPRGRALSASTVGTPDARAASDHLPLRAVIAL